MPDKLEERIEQIIDEKLGLYKPKTERRRTANEIRDQIQEELEKRPKTTHELQNAINATKSTVENHCNHLKKLEVVDKTIFQDKNYWKKLR